MTGAPGERPAMGEVLARIERELRELWSAEAVPGEPARSRVCTMNLVVVAGTPAIGEAYTAVVDEITLTTPARSIVVTMDPTAEGALLDGDVTAVCSVEGPDLACSERVRLRATGAACARVGSAVDALLVPEIPTSLVWLGRVHPDDPVFRELAQDAQRILLDTDYTSLASLLTLARWAREDSSRPAVADLAWTRLSTWQELTARFFDDPPHRPLAQSVDALRIMQASEPGARLGSEGALFIGWLATRLGLHLDRLGGALRLPRADGAPVQLELRAVPRPATVAPLALAGLMLTASASGARLRGEIERELGSGRDSDPSPDADVLRWRLVPIEGATVEQRVRLGGNKSARVLVRTLQRPAHDPLLVEAVAFAEQLYEDGVVCE